MPDIPASSAAKITAKHLACGIPFWDTLRLMWSECDADKIIILGEDTLPKNFLPQCEIMHRLIEDAAEERKKYGENELTYVVVK